MEYQFQKLNNSRFQEARVVIGRLEEEIRSLQNKLAELTSIKIEFNPALKDKEVADLFKQLSTLHFADGKPIIVTPHRKLSQFLPLICKPFEDKKGTDSLRNYLSGADDKQDRYQLPPEKRRIHIVISDK